MDSTIISAPSSTKNKRKKRDPDAYQVKKGNTWHFGYKAHIGVDKDSGLVHTVEATAANVHDVTQVSKLLTGEEEVVYGDSGYLCEVEDEKAVKDFLEDEVQLLKMNGTNGVFQAAEGYFNSPAHSVETFQGGGGEALRSQVGNEKFGTVVFCFNTDDPERKGSKVSAFWL